MPSGSVAAQIDGGEGAADGLGARFVAGRQGLRRAEFHAERRGADRRRRWSAATAARRQGRGAKFGKRKDGESADGNAAQERVARHGILPSSAGQGGATDLNGFRRRTFGRSDEGRRSARRGAAVWPRRDKGLRRRRPRREIVFDATDRKNGVRRRRRAPADLAERAGASIVIKLIRRRLIRLALRQRRRRSPDKWHLAIGAFGASTDLDAIASQGDTSLATSARRARRARSWRMRIGSCEFDAVNFSDAVIAHEPVNRDFPSLRALSKVKKSTKRQLCHSCAPCVGNSARHSPSRPLAR